jgi:hypothetical protein
MWTSTLVGVVVIFHDEKCLQNCLEKRMKAAYLSYEERNLPILK